MKNAARARRSRVQVDSPIDEIPDDVRQSNALFVSVLRRYAYGFQHSDVIERGGLAICWADVPLPMYNNISFTGRIDDTGILAARAQEAAAYARTKRQAGLITVCHDLLGARALAEAENAFGREAYVPAMRLIGMVGEVRPMRSTRHPALYIERQDDGRVVTDLNCIARGFPLEVGRASVPEPSFWRGVFAYVAFEAGQPVATATTIVQDECLYVALVATVPEARGNGYAKATLRLSLQRAHEATGFRKTILHATEAGYPMYQRLGYLAAAGFTCYKPGPKQ
jgi:hypothetical protein